MRFRANRPWASVRLIVAVALAGSAMSLTAAPASAHHCTGDGDIYEGGGEVVAECHGVTPGQPGGGSVHELWDVYCSEAGPFQEGDEVGFYEVAPVTAEEVALFGFDPTGEYMWYDVICWRDGRGEIETQIIVEITAPISPEAMRDIAAARLVPPSPDPETSPPLAEQTFVRVSTWLWLDPAAWSPIEVSETRGLTTVTVRATPTHARWVMGDGGGTTCAGPGVVWTSGLSEDATDCSYDVRAQLLWRAGWSFRSVGDGDVGVRVVDQRLLPGCVRHRRSGCSLRGGGRRDPSRGDGRLT